MAKKKPAKIRKKDIAELKMRQLDESSPKPVIVELGEYRPYSAKYHCKRVLELGKLGASETQIAVGLGISRTALRRWKREHEEFAEAMALAMTLSEAHWEARWVSRMDLFGHNANAYKHMMASRFRETYGEKVQVSGDDEHPLTVITRRIVKAPPRESQT